MRHQRIIDHTTRSLLDAPSTRYICRQCIAQQPSRAFHNSIPRTVDKPWWHKIKDGFLGNKEEEEARRRREAAQDEKFKQLSAGEVIQSPTKVVNGFEYQLAQAVHPQSYTPAKRMQGMPAIGSEKWIKKVNDHGEQYVGFSPSQKAQLSGAQWAALLRHVIIEIMTLHKHRKDIQNLFNERPANTHMITRRAVIHVDSSGEVKLEFAEPDDEQQLLSQLLHKNKTRNHIAVQEQHDGEILHDAANLGKREVIPEPLSLKEDSTVLVPNQALLKKTLNAIIADTPPFTTHLERDEWRTIPVTDLGFKLAIVKRFKQLTGHRLSDLTISKATRMDDIYHAASYKTTPDKLAETKQVQRLDVELPNITVYKTKRTLIHKEQEIGRWKLIRQELESRQLPAPKRIRP